MKKGQTHFIPIFVLGGVVIVLIFVFGYKAVQSLTSKQETVTQYKIENDLRNDIKEIASQYGTARTFSYSGDKIDKICFYDKTPVKDDKDIFCPNTCSSDMEPFKLDITKDTNHNILVYEDTLPRSFYVEDVRNNCCDFYCIENQGGAIKIMMEGRGKYALVGK